ncbi:MAG TPA: lysylphosphatidylglycerol synthase transmembrane domain-containing protein [Acidimicrobiales bacterium]|nr:lysylphosphatidylglycerol synthase transmembrane domain-containing protein [Acidimicrobiales bacterium]
MDVRSEHAKQRRRQVWTIVRVVASAVMLAILLPRAAGYMRPVLHLSTLAWLAAAVVVTLAGVVLATLRWHRVLAALDVRTRISTLLSHYLAGLFVSNFLPTTIGGDVLRVSRLAAGNGESPRSFASVVLERLTGWLVLPVISLVTLAINPGLLRPPVDDASHLVVVISVVTLTLLGVVLVGASSPRVGRRLQAQAGWLRFVNAIHLGLARFRRSPGMAFEVLVAGFAYQLAVVFAAFLSAKALGLPVSWTAVLAFMPAVAIVQVLPAPTIGGLGVREGAFVLFLHPLGVSADQAITLGLLVYGINLVASLFGAPAFAVGNRSVSTTPTAA